MGLGAMGGTFLRFPEERRQAIADRCIDLFNALGYAECSTNQLKEALDIAKGTFYKYILSKEQLYLYLAESVLQEMTGLRNDPDIPRSPDIIQRFVALNGKFFDYYKAAPGRCLFLMNIIGNPSAPFFRQIEERRLELVQAKFGHFLEGVDWNRYRLGKDEILSLLSWTIGGHRQDVHKRLRLGDNPDTVAADAKHEQDLILAVLSQAFLRPA